jgi:hypothetical protein
VNVIGTEEIFYSSPSPEDVFCFSPSLLAHPSGKLYAAFDFGGPGVGKLPGPKTGHGDYGAGNQGKIFRSDDNGKTWQQTADLAMYHARLFADGNRLYFIGHDKGITISASDDEGMTWTEIRELESTETWHQSPCAYHIENGYIYLTMEKSVGDFWPDVSPVVLRGKLGTDLTDKANWTFSNALDYPSDLPTTLGVPFYKKGLLDPENEKDMRFCGDPCFLESHVMKIRDKKHILYEENTVHIWMRQHSGLTNIAALAKCKINADGSMDFGLETSPAGTPMLHVPFPGGQMKFDIRYDEKSGYYWLVCTQTTDSMTRVEYLPKDRYGLPDNERHRLALYFSKNMFDWCFAGIVAIGKTNKCSRHYAAMEICGGDILILSRSGDENAKSAHNGNILTLHRVCSFRSLIY